MQLQLHLGEANKHLQLPGLYMRASLACIMVLQSCPFYFHLLYFFRNKIKKGARLEPRGSSSPLRNESQLNDIGPLSLSLSLNPIHLIGLFWGKQEEERIIHYDHHFELFIKIIMAKMNENSEIYKYLVIKLNRIGKQLCIIVIHHIQN